MTGPAILESDEVGVDEIEALLTDAAHLVRIRVFTDPQTARRIARWGNATRATRSTSTTELERVEASYFTTGSGRQTRTRWPCIWCWRPTREQVSRVRHPGRGYVADRSSPDATAGDQVMFDTARVHVVRRQAAERRIGASCFPGYRRGLPRMCRS